ncbi:MAG: ribosome biogenesis factor YjgA [Pseudomonadota bacterium]
MTTSDETQPLEGDEPSKSARKREAQAILDMAKTLVDLGDKLFQGLALDDEVREAAVLARKIRAHGGRKRQIQFLAKLMRGRDTDAIQAQLEAIDNRAETSKREHHRLEQWRDRLIDEGDTALVDLLDQWPHADRQQLRQLIRNAQREREREQAPKSARALFQYLKAL